MHLQSIKLTNFKNYQNQSLDFSAQLNCFVGKNGMGKTNLLDAIYYLCMCKSALGMTDANLVLHGEDFFRLEGLFAKTGKKQKIVAKVIPRKKKEIECNDVPYNKLTEHIGLLPVVMIVPDDTRMATEGSEERRRFMDNTLSQLDPVYLEALLRYNRLLKQRNSALKQMAANRQFDEALLKTYNQQLLAPSEILFAKRKDFQQRLLPVLQEFYAIISNGHEQVSCTYKSQLLEASLEELLATAVEKDRILQRTTVGVHRDDLLFSIDGYPLKKYASQGQLKSFVLALRLAQYEVLRVEKKEQPMLLLDDIFDKLDRSRVRQLVGLLLERDFGQVFISDTEEGRLGTILSSFSLEYCRFVIKEGNVEEKVVINSLEN